ncbi:MAG TPA: hypothetical protein VN886_13185 [Acidimicrobiales bacterium]|nr:hypothetical protein [Acidimicrobiales bacterium]
MSRGLGRQQLALLAYAARPRGLPVSYVPEILNLTPRRGRKVVLSLRSHGLVVVVQDPVIGRRIFTPEAYEGWKRAQRHLAHLTEQLQLYPNRRYEPVRAALGEKVAR